MDHTREAEAMGATKIQDRGDVVVEEYGEDMMIEHGKLESAIIVRDRGRWVVTLPLRTARTRPTTPA